MNYRQATILGSEDCSTDGIKTLDLKGMDKISRLLINMRMTNNGSTPTAHPVKAFTKVELIDGSNVLWSLSGPEAAALNFYQNGRPTVDGISYVDNEITNTPLAINFGRWLWDEELALDPARFKNPQLKITHDISAGGSSPDAGTLEVVAQTFDELNISPLGWMMAKEYNTYTLVASSKQAIQLPTDYPMRMLIIQSLYAGKQPWEMYHDIKLTENNDKRIPIDQNTSDLLKYIGDYWGTYNERFRTLMTGSAVTHYVAPTYFTSITGSEENGGTAAFSASLCYGGTLDVKGSAAGQANVKAEGYCPHGAMPLLFGDLWDMNRWYDVTKIAKLELQITAGSSPGTTNPCNIVTEQLRRY